MNKFLLIVLLGMLLVGCPKDGAYRIDLRDDNLLVDESRFEGIGVCSTLGERQGALFTLYGMLKPTGNLPRGANVQVVYRDGSSELVNVLSTTSTVGIVPVAGTQHVASGKVVCDFDMP